MKGTDCKASLRKTVSGRVPTHHHRSLYPMHTLRGLLGSLNKSNDSDLIAAFDFMFNSENQIRNPKPCACMHKYTET